MSSTRKISSSEDITPNADGGGLFEHARLLWWGLIGVMFLVGLAVRLYDLGAPPVDFHPTRQLHSALIARGMYYENRTDVSASQRELAVLQWRTEGVIEPQVFERLTAWSYQLAGAADLRIPRVYALVMWMAAAVFITLIAVRITGKGGALVAAWFFLIWPYGVAASRAFQPEPLFIALMTAGIWAAMRWEERPTWPWTITAGLLCGLAIYIKAVALFFLTPALVVLLLARGGLRRAVRDPRTWVLGALCVLPYAAYLVDGVYLNRYLVDQFSKRFFPEMWVDPAFYLRWVSNLERVVPVELVLISLLGIFSIRRPVYRGLLLAIAAGYLGYGMTLSHHISTHDYYHLPMFPQVALGLAAAGSSLFRQLRGPRGIALAAASAALIAALLLNGYEARTVIRRSGAWDKAESWSEIGRELGEGASAAALVTDYGVGLKYYAWINPEIWPTAADIRFQESSGQSFEFETFFENQVAGRDFFIISPLDELEKQPELNDLLYSRYPVVGQSADYAIFDLRGGVPENATQK